MADNLTLTMGFTDVKELINSIDIGASEYCVLYTNHPSDTVIITSNDGFKLLLLKTYSAKEISDWDFNEQYLQNKIQNYTIVGNNSLIDKGY